ncbi:MAG: hypothetical protein HY743_09495 [Deltaproteobacteria bacterium]|nr:hypothetical protein [Deltaproteobacteria bacterium]
MSHPRADALDSLEHLACKLDAVAALMTTEPTNLGENEVFGLNLIINQAAGEIRRAKGKLEKLYPAN